MKTINGQVVAHQQKNEQATANAQPQADDVERCEHSVIKEASQGDGEIISYHLLFILLKINFLSRVLGFSNLKNHSLRKLFTGLAKAARTD
jgi:hypothetical protein